MFNFDLPPDNNEPIVISKMSHNLLCAVMSVLRGEPDKIRPFAEEAVRRGIEGAKEFLESLN